MVVLVIWDRMSVVAVEWLFFILWNSCVEDGFVKIRRLSR